MSDAEWNDWKWQLKNRVTRIEQLERLLPSMTREERAGVLLAGESKLALAITPSFFNLIDASDEFCPIRRQVIPRVEETTTAPWETWTRWAKTIIRRCRVWCTGIPTGCFFW